MDRKGKLADFLRFASLLLLVLLTMTLSLLIWGERLLVSSDLMPLHADALVVLQGSIAGERARLVGAVRFMQQGMADRILLSIPKESYWGQTVAPLARHYIDATYGPGVASQVEFCETGPEVNSTQQEAAVLIECIQKQSWHSIVVVTSDYHTRRARIIWRRVVQQRRAPIELWLEGVADPEFRASGWWRDRLSAKTWLSEFTKLLWVVVRG